MLVSEQFAGPGQAPDSLLVLYAVPRRWLQDSKTIRVQSMPTVCGPISFEI